MRTGIAVSTVGAVALAVLAGSADVAAAAGPDVFFVEVAAASGPGCLPGTTQAGFRGEREAFVIDYSDYTAWAGGASKPTDFRKTCQITLNVGHPEVYTYAITRVDYRLRGDLQPGAQATQKASYSFENGSPAETHRLDLRGPYKQGAQVTYKVPEDKVEWKACGEKRNLSINTELRVDRGTSDASKVSSITMNSADGTVPAYHLAWKTCR